MKLSKSTIFILSFLVLTTMACKKDEKQADIDQQLIEAYIKTNNLKTNVTSTGLHYVILEEGNGPLPSPGITTPLYVDYIGTLLNGSEFDRVDPDNDGPFKLYLKNVIKGWTEGLPYFKKGSKGILIIPSKLAYGSSERSGIPANSVLVFNITMVDF